MSIEAVKKVDNSTAKVKPQKKKMNPILKGGIIGSAVGLGVNGVAIGFLYNFPQIVDKFVKDAAKEEAPPDVKYMLDSCTALLESVKLYFAQELPQLKSQIPKALAKGAIPFTIFGAAIGTVVYFINKKKSNDKKIEEIKNGVNVDNNPKEAKNDAKKDDIENKVVEPPKAENPRQQSSTLNPSAILIYKNSLKPKA